MLLVAANGVVWLKNEREKGMGFRIEDRRVKVPGNLQYSICVLVLPPVDLGAHPTYLLVVPRRTAEFLYFFLVSIYYSLATLAESTGTSSVVLT